MVLGYLRCAVGVNAAVKKKKREKEGSQSNWKHVKWIYREIFLICLMCKELNTLCVVLFQCNNQ